MSKMFYLLQQGTIPFFLQLCALFTLLLTARLTTTYARILILRRRLPPGPFPLPLLGNYIDMRMKRPWVHWERLANKYQAPLMTLWNGHRPVIVCSDAWTISELFEKRANIYSSRPQMVCMGDLTNTSENNQVCLQYGEKWRLHRRLTVCIGHPAKVHQCMLTRFCSTLLLAPKPSRPTVPYKATSPKSSSATSSPIPLNTWRPSSDTRAL